MSSFPSDTAATSQPGRAELWPRVNSAAHNLPGWSRPVVRLRRLPVDEAEGLLTGRGVPAAGLRWHEDYPMAETLGALWLVTAAHRACGWTGHDPPQWWLHQILLDDLVVGDIGFRGPPPGDQTRAQVEIGYHVVDTVRGRGVATRACALLLEHAWLDGAEEVVAEVESDHEHGPASRRVLARAGFRQVAPEHFLVTRPRAAR